MKYTQIKSCIIFNYSKISKFIFYDIQLKCNYLNQNAHFILNNIAG